MSVMDFDMARRYAPHSLSFPDYYYDRNAPLATSHAARSDPRGYPLGGPVGNSRRPGVGRDDPMIDVGSARRRIAVACARCRKRKIRCSGDPGNGAGCTNCRQAGVEGSQCQFHRVGSDNVKKVLDHYHLAHHLTGMANSDGMMPIYSANATTSMCPRPMSSHTYPQLETKPMYPSTWSMPYSDDTSPIDAYGLDQSAAYLPNPTPSMYSSACRWTHPIAKASSQGLTAYYDHEPNGLPYLHTNNLRSTAASEATSPLNMSSFHRALPDRPVIRQNPMLESAGPRRQLPFPQPSGAQSSRNAVDQLQDQRLRSAQAMGASSTSNGVTFSKALLSWGTEYDSQTNASVVTASETSTQLPTTADGTLDFLATTAPVGSDVHIASGTTQLQINFSTPPLLDTMNAPAPTNTYSNFRGSRMQGAVSTSLTRRDSHTNMYSFNTDSNSKRDSLSGRSSNNGNLVNGTPYQPLPDQLPQATSIESSQCQSRQNRTTPLHRESMGNINGSPLMVSDLG